MILNISGRKLTVIECGEYFFELSDYPHITELELSKIIAFLRYEKLYGRQTEIKCGSDDVLSIINNAIAHLDSTDNILPPAENEFVYHATDIHAAQKILSGDKLLSAAKVYGKTGEELAFKKHNSRWNDPADYFEYIMFCWGDAPTGDYVVLSESFPSEDDLANGNFNAGIRFYFRYEDIVQHPMHTFDGYHAIKIKDEILLSDYLYACIVPEQYKNALTSQIPSALAAKLHYLSQDQLGISDWNKKVYNFVCSLQCKLGFYRK